MSRRKLDLLHYGLATLTQAGTGVLMVPLLARVLSQEAFGTWTLFEPALLLAAQLALAGCNYGAVKLVGQDRLLPGVAFRALARFALASSLLVGAGGAVVTALWFGGVAVAPWVGLLIASEALYLLGMAALRGGNLAAGFAAGSAAKAMVVLGGGLGAVYAGWPVLHNADDVLRLYACASVAGLVMVSISLRQPSGTDATATPPPPTAAVQSALAYGWPLLAAGVLNSVVASSDRYVLGAHLGVQEVAVYVVIVKLANLLNLLANPVNLWFPAARFRHAGDADGGQAFFSRLAVWTTYGYCGVGATMWLLAPWVLTWFAPGFSWDAHAGAALICAAVCLAIAPPMNVGLLAQGKTRWNFVIGLVCAAYQLGSLALWVPMLGLLGAGIATLSAQALSLVLQHVGSQRTHPLHWPYTQQALIGAAAIGLCAMAQLPGSAASRCAVLLFGWGLLGALLMRRDGRRPPLPARSTA